MPKIIYVEFSRTEHVIDVPRGCTVMEGAVQNGIPGIDADCGGACACGTCHVYVDPAWVAKTGSPNTSETGMMELVKNIAPTSRLACQIKVTDELDGLVVRMPATQSQP